MEAVFLGLNKAGEKVYEWLNQREDIEIKALLTEKDQLTLIQDIEPEIVIASGFEHKVPENILNVPEKGIINLHPSFLPYNRGPHPYIWPILEETPAGVSIHYMDSEIDEGKIIAKREVSVRPDDTAQSLYNRLQDEQFIHFKQNWEEVKQDPETVEQNLEKGSTNYRKDLEDVRELDLEEESTVGELIDKLRALSFPPHQNAYFEKNGRKYFVDVRIKESLE